MSTSWARVAISEVIDWQEGPGILAKDFREVGVPLVRLAGLERGEHVLAGCNFLDPEMVERRWSHFRLSTGDTLLSTSASLGRIAVVTPDAAGAIAYTGIIRFRPKHDRVVPEFIRYVLLGKDFQDQAEAVGAGSVIRHFGPTHLRHMSLWLPPIETQRAIAAVLGSLDDKIEQNRRTARALERLARAIFRAWFVDFEPVKAKAAGAASFPSMPQAVFDALPTTLIDSDLGPVPEGWEVKSATEVAQVAIGKTPPRKEPQWFSTDPTNVPWVSIADMGSSGVFVRGTSEYLTPEAIDRHAVRRIPSGSVLFSFKLTVGRVAIADGEITSNEAIAHFVPTRPDAISSEYLYCYLAGYDHTQLGSTSSIATATNSKAVKAMPVLVPPEDVSSAFTTFARPIFDRLRATSRESDQLATVRDYLLPRLLSGALPVEVQNA